MLPNWNNTTARLPVSAASDERLVTLFKGQAALIARVERLLPAR